MATKQEIKARAKEIIERYPSAGKERINKQLRAEYGIGLRSSTVLQLKSEVADEKPRLIPELYGRGSVPKALNNIYKGWIASGFLPFEARELTLGHGDRYRNFDAQAVYDSIPGQKARQTRTDLIRDQLRAGWTKQQIRENILDFYIRSKTVDPWKHIRAEYKPRKKADYREYKAKARKRARTSQRRLKKEKPIATTKPEWIEQLRTKMRKSTSPVERQRFRQQIINLGGMP